MAMSITDGLELVSPVCYERGYPHDTWSRLRRESPVHQCEPPGYGPFWAITRHADICDISKRPAPVPERAPDRDARRRADARAAGQPGLNGMKAIIEMDPPTHRSFRRVASGS